MDKHIYIYIINIQMNEKFGGYHYSSDKNKTNRGNVRDSEGQISHGYCSKVVFQMGFQGVEFLPSKGSFSTTFLNNCGTGESLKTITCAKTVVGVSKGMLPEKYFHSNKASFYVS